MTIISLASGKKISSLPKGCSAALGFFDGVHIGHRAILTRAVSDAAERRAPSAVWMITTDGKSKGRTFLLTDENEKLRLIRELGIDYAVIASFEDIRNLSGEEFVRGILCGSLCVSTVVCGFNFRFGKGAAWGTDELSLMCQNAGINQITVPAVSVNGENVSSSRIRQLIAEGDVESAAELLGRPYFFRLPVVNGKMLGRRLGFPTANQLPPTDLVCPPRGVYATSAELADVDGTVKAYPGSTNIGVCPTVTAEILGSTGLSQDADGAANVERAVAETYIDGFDGDIYGQILKVSFLKRIRGEVKFPSVDALTQQIKKDSENARAVFESHAERNGY